MMTTTTTDPLAEYLVLYPVSGERVRLSGTLRVGPIEDEFAVGFEVSRGMYVRGTWVTPGSIVIIDSRCAVWDAEKHPVYNPREYVAKMDRGMQHWMEQHPRWPPKRPPA